MLHIGSLIQTLAKGGPVMIPLVICSVLALAVVVERLAFWWRQGDVGPAERALELAERGKLDEALEIARASRTATARVIAAGLAERQAPPADAMEAATQTEMSRLRNYLPVLDTIITLSPLLGLLGTPPPADLTDAARQAQLSVFGLYNTITLGIEGTGMTGFAALSEAQRWALAFHVSTLAGAGDERARGAALWKGGTGKRELGDLRALVMATPREMSERLGGDGAGCSPTCAASRARSVGRESAIDLSVRLLGESVEAYRRGDAPRAHRLAVTGYLEGFELVEAPLGAVDGALDTRVESEMMRYRSMVQAGAPVEAVEAQARAVQALLGPRGSASTRSGCPPPRSSRARWSSCCARGSRPSWYWPR